MNQSKKKKSKTPMADDTDDFGKDTDNNNKGDEGKTEDFAQELMDARKAYAEELATYESESNLSSMWETKGAPPEVAHAIWENVIREEMWSVKKAERVAAGVNVNALTELPNTREMNTWAKRIKMLERWLEEERPKTKEEKEADAVNLEKATARSNELLQKAQEYLMKLSPVLSGPDPTGERISKELAAAQQARHDAIVEAKAETIPLQEKEIQRYTTELAELRKNLDVTKQQRQADRKVVGAQFAGIPEVAAVLRTSDALWRNWWFNDFPRFEHDLKISLRGLPQWILNQKMPTPPTAADPPEIHSEYRVLQQYENVPWRRFYAWCKFFERRCAKFVAMNAAVRAAMYAQEVENVPAGVVLRNPISVVRWGVGKGSKVYITELDWPQSHTDDGVLLPRRAALEVAAFDEIPAGIFAGNQGSPYMAWENMKVSPFGIQPQTPRKLCMLLGNTPALFPKPENGAQGVTYTYNFLTNGVKIPDDCVVTNYETYDRDPIIRFGIILMSFIVWYNDLELCPLTEEEFFREMVGRVGVPTYEQYIFDFNEIKQDREDAYFGIVQRRYNPHFINQLMPGDRVLSTERPFWALEGLPVVPMRGEINLSSTAFMTGGEKNLNRIKQAGGVRFLGNSAPLAPSLSDTTRSVCDVCDKKAKDGASLFRCKICKGAIYCSQECQKADWDIAGTQLGHRFLCEKMKGKK